LATASNSQPGLLLTFAKEGNAFRRHPTIADGIPSPEAWTLPHFIPEDIPEAFPVSLSLSLSSVLVEGVVMVARA